MSEVWLGVGGDSVVCGVREPLGAAKSNLGDLRRRLGATKCGLAAVKQRFG